MASRSTTQTAGPLPPRSLEFERECVRFFEEVVQVFGVPKSVGQIYGLLYASPLPLSFSDIVGKLEISKGSASQGLQLLRSLGAINVADHVGDVDRNLDSASQIATRASRAIAYEPELALRQLVTGMLRERIAPMASTGGDRLKRLREFAEQSPDGTTFYLGRIKQLETWRKRFNTVLPLLTALLGPKKKKK